MDRWSGTEHNWINEANLELSLQNVRLLIQKWGKTTGSICLRASQLAIGKFRYSNNKALLRSCETDHEGSESIAHLYVI